MRKQSSRFKLPLAVALVFMLLMVPVLADQKSAVDLQGPEYTGNVLMAQNITTDIDSDEKRDAAQSLGLPGETAQGSELETGGNQVRCLTPQLGTTEVPELSENRARSAANTTYAVGDTKEIYTDYYNGDTTLFTAEVVAVGETCTIWRDTSHPELMDTETAQAYANVIDNQIHDPLYEAFGDWSAADVDGDGKTAFVFYPINGAAGLFNALDLFTEDETEYATGNLMDMLHVDFSDGDSFKVTSATIAHELQHLINFARVEKYSDYWMNETLSQSAVALAGLSDTETIYEVGYASKWIKDNGYSYPFIYSGDYVPRDDQMGIPYGTWYLFGRYLSYQTASLEGGGDAVYKAIIDGCRDHSGIEALELALRDIGYMGEGKTVESMEALVTNFNLAMFLREDSGLYSLTDDPENPLRVSGVVFDRIFPLASNLESLPGGGAASWSSLTGSVTPENYGENVSFAGITTEVLSGVYTSDIPTEGSVVYGKSITLETQDTDAQIYYTTDGSDPLTQGILYTEPVVLEKSMTLKACTVKGTSLYSRTASWDIQVRAGDVTADPASGSIAAGDKVTLSTDVPGAQIYYTTDGSEPTEASMLYTEPLALSETTTLKACALIPGSTELLPGAVRTFTYEVGKNGDRYEVNDTLEQATALSFPGKIEATIHNMSDTDYYAFSLDNGAALNLTLTLPDGKDYSLTLLDDKGEVIKTADNGSTSQSIRTRVSSGKYFVKVESMDESASELEPYTLSLMKQMDEEALADLDFSEMNMLTAMSDTGETGSGYAWSLGPDGGGNFLMSMTYFSNWGGPVDEALDSYHDTGDFSYKNLSDQTEYHVQNAIYLPNDSRENYISHVKNAVYSYGAADIYILAASVYQTPDYKNFYVDDSYTYADLEGDGGHIVTIVGWDDNYSRDNFTGNPDHAKSLGYTDVDIPKPEKDGAFIVKNSWGEERGEGGYFYLSYEDAFMMANNPAIFIGDEASDNYNHQYYYDDRGAVGFQSQSVPVVYSEKFTNQQGAPELLKAVSFQSGSEDTRYEISVTVNGETKKVAQGVKKYAGFYTEQLDKAITIPDGAEFEISVRLESTKADGDGQVSIGVCYNVAQDGANLVNGVVPVAGVAFEEVGGVKKDLGAEGTFPCIRAYTCDVTERSYISSGLEDNQPETAASDLQAKTQSQENLTIQGQETASVNGALAVSIDSSTDTEVSARSLPERFDLRETGTLTAVKYQGNLGSCWTFAAMASLESTVAANGGFAVDHPQGISLDASEKTVLLTAAEPQKQIELTASLVGADSPATEKIFWRVSGDADSVSLDVTSTMNGETAPVLTALKPGVVTVTAASDADMTVTASCQITITAQGVESITLTPDRLTLKPGETAAITAETAPEGALDSQVVWSSDHPEIANVDDKGVVTALSGGTATITAKAGTATAVATVVVKGGPAVNPGVKNPGTGLLQDSVLSAVVCAGILALAILGGLYYKRKAMR